MGKSCDCPPPPLFPPPPRLPPIPTTMACQRPEILDYRTEASSQTPYWHVKQQHVQTKQRKGKAKLTRVGWAHPYLCLHQLLWAAFSDTSLLWLRSRVFQADTRNCCHKQHLFARFSIVLARKSRRYWNFPLQRITKNNVQSLEMRAQKAAGSTGRSPADLPHSVGQVISCLSLLQFCSSVMEMMILNSFVKCSETYCEKWL